VTFFWPLAPIDFLTGSGGAYGALVSPAFTGYFVDGAGRAFGAGFDDGKAFGAGFDDGRAFCAGLLSVFFTACFFTAPPPPAFGAVAFWIEVPYELMPLPTASNLPAMPSQKRNFVSMLPKGEREKSRQLTIPNGSASSLNQVSYATYCISSVASRCGDRSRNKA
jgi:hypothetical protein